MRTSHRRLLVLFGLLLSLVAFDWLWRRWTPTCAVQTQNYAIQSTATPEQTQEIGRVLEALHTAYTETLAGYPQVTQPHDKLQIKLFRDRKEFRRCNRIWGWAEAFYSKPCCYQYYRQAMWKVFAASGTPESFEEHVGPIEEIQVEWHRHLREQCRLLGVFICPARGSKPAEKTRDSRLRCPWR